VQRQCRFFETQCTFIHIYLLNIKAVHKQVKNKTYKAQGALTAASTTNKHI